jgi:hypothetical protein
LGKIINLAVEHKPETLVLVAHGLTAVRGQIDDAQSAMAQPHRAVQVKSLVVGPSISKGLGHAPEKILRDRLAGEINYPANAAHESFLILDCRFSIKRLSGGNHECDDFFSFVLSFGAFSSILQPRARFR